ncbi:MAG TPA: hypothetical protein VN626_11050 [Clostridia bacterium]|nr:hypothetical protein [Clostridia bacterium]
MNDYDFETAATQNKAIRGYILRSLVKGTQYRLYVRQIVNALLASSMIISPDISKHLAYLQEAGYIQFDTPKLTAYTVYIKDGVIRLTRKGIDLVEGTIEDDGVDV